MLDAFSNHLQFIAAPHDGVHNYFDVGTSARRLWKLLL
jgi:hypothetical protein